MSRPFAILAFLVSLPSNASRKRSRDSRSGGIVFTLGDSFSSGVGIHRPIGKYPVCPDLGEDSPAFCCRDHEKIAGALYANTVNMRTVNVACGGSVVSDIVKQFDNAVLGNPHFAAEVANQFNNDVILFTIGGDNWKSKRGDTWPALLIRCMAELQCHTKSDNQNGNWDSVAAQLDSFYDTLATRASKAHIRVMGYPRWMTWKFPCLTVPGTSKAESVWGDAIVDEMNSRINQSVAKVRRNHPNVDFRFVPVDNYLDKGACYAIDPHVSSFRAIDPTGLSRMTLHPTEKGHESYFHALKDSLK